MLSDVNAIRGYAAYRVLSVGLVTQDRVGMSQVSYPHVVGAVAGWNCRRQVRHRPVLSGRRKAQ